MKGLSPRTWLLVQKLFPSETEAVGQLLLQECGQNLPFCEGKDEYQLERLRFAALKVGNGDLALLRRAVDEAKRDWRDELVWAGFAERLEAHNEWAESVLGPE